MTVLLVCLQLSVVSPQLEGETFVFGAAAQSNFVAATRRAQRHLLALRQDAPSWGVPLFLAAAHPQAPLTPHSPVLGAKPR